MANSNGQHLSQASGSPQLFSRKQEGVDFATQANDLARKIETNNQRQFLTNLSTLLPAQATDFAKQAAALAKEAEASSQARLLQQVGGLFSKDLVRDAEKKQIMQTADTLLNNLAALKENLIKQSAMKANANNVITGLFAKAEATTSATKDESDSQSFTPVK